MAYLLVALTFIASILFYSFYPRTDTLELLDMPMAETAIYDLVSQHTAIVNAATVTKVQQGRTRQTYELLSGNWPRFTGRSVNGRLDAAQFVSSNDLLFRDFVPPMYLESSEQQNMRVLMPTSALVCVNNYTSLAGEDCGASAENSVSNSNLAWGTSDFIITVMSLKEIHDEFGLHSLKLLERALGRVSLLTNYDNDMGKDACIDSSGNPVSCSVAGAQTSPKMHLTTNCGIIVNRAGFDSINALDYDPNNANYALANTKHVTVTIPKAFTSKYTGIGDRTHLACITSLKATYAGCCTGLSRNLCGASTEVGRYGCFWNVAKSKCDSICASYGTQNECEVTNGTKYGCKWRRYNEKGAATSVGKCTNSCGIKRVYPKKIQ